ncbi:hypothetical protein HDU96_001043 [Phlyctochytrium bullatum]|nr:hypothetical protein HDU96_001043 [Phlyctochytrium bullatum]
MASEPRIDGCSDHRPSSSAYTSSIASSVLLLLAATATLPTTVHADATMDISAAAGTVIANGQLITFGGLVLEPQNVTADIIALNISAPGLASANSVKINAAGSASNLTIALGTCFLEERFNRVHCLGGENANANTLPEAFRTKIRVFDLSNSTWLDVNVPGIPGVSCQNAVLMPDGKAYHFSGHEVAPNPDFAIEVENILGIYDPVALKYQQRDLRGPNPPGRGNACIVPVGNTTIFMFGGSTPRQRFYNDTYILDVSTGTWTNLTTSEPGTAPSERRASACFLSKDKKSVILFGGTPGAFEALSDMWQYDLERRQWTPHPANASLAKPSGRWWPNVAVAGDYVIMTGGLARGAFMTRDNAVHFFDLNRNDWVTAPDGPLLLTPAQSYYPPGTYFGTSGTAPAPSTTTTAAVSTAGAGSGGTTIVILPTASSSASSSSSTDSGPLGMSTRTIIIASSVGACVAVIGVALVVFMYYQKQRSRQRERDEQAKVGASLAGRSRVDVDGTMYAHGKEEGRGLWGSSTMGSDKLPAYETGARGDALAMPPAAVVKGAGGVDGYGTGAAGVVQVLFKQPLRDDRLIGNGTLDRVMQPLPISYFDASPNATLANRYVVTGPPLSSASSRFLVVPAEDLQTRERLAIKLFTPSGPGDRDSAFYAKEAFTREVALLRKLKSQSVVSLQGFQTLVIQNGGYAGDGDLIHVAALHLCTENLSQFLARTTRMQDLLIRTIVRGICEGVSFLADNNIVHCDLKPSNILLIDGVFVRLADFESARVANRETVSTASLSYASPEVAQAIHRSRVENRPIETVATHAVDMWAVGCIVFEMYSGRALTSGLEDGGDGEEGILHFLLSRDPIHVPQGLVPAVQARNLLASLLSRDAGARKMARQVLASAYLNAGMDTVEIHQSRGRMEEKIERVEMQVRRVATATEKIQEAQGVVKRILANNMEAYTPRIISLLPAQGGVKWSQFEYWGSDLFRLHLLCEWPGGDPQDDARFYGQDSKGYVGPHLTTDPGYAVADPREFARACGPVLQAGMAIAAAAAGAGALVMGRMGGGGGGGGINGRGGPFASFGVRPTEYFDKLTDILEQVKKEAAERRKQQGGRGRGGSADDDDPVMGRRLEGQALRELFEFLKANDQGRRLGGLQKCVDKDGSVLWLCEHHAHIVRRRFDVTNKRSQLQEDESIPVMEEAPILSIDLADVLASKSPFPPNSTFPLTLEHVRLPDPIIPPGVPADARPKAYLLRNVLSLQECKALIDFAESTEAENGCSDGPMLRLSDDGRNNTYVSTHRAMFRAPRLSQLMWQRVSALLELHDEQVSEGIHIRSLSTEGTNAIDTQGKQWKLDERDPHMVGRSWKMEGRWRATGLNEVWRLARYDPGGHFGPHRDGFLQLDVNHRSFKTLMFYLNDDFDGGPTNFLADQGIHRDENGRIRGKDGTILAQVHPEPGLVLVFNHALLHEGGTVVSGRKYILRSEIMYERVADDGQPSLSALNDRETRAITLKGEAELLESAGKAMEAMQKYREAFKLCPDLEKF